MKRVKQRQLKFVFADNPKGNGHNKDVAEDVSKAKIWLLRIAKVKESESLTAHAVDTNQMLKQAAAMPNLARALLNVARNKGSSGVDRISVEEVVKRSRSLLSKLHRSLLDGKYRAGEIRRVWIPKPGGGKRGLGIPNVVDRIVQQSILQVLEPVFEPMFHDSSHGFRPSRGAQTAVKEAKGYVEQGHNVVVDMDLSKFFDKVNHQRLLNRMALHVKDKEILKLIHQMLKTKVVMPDGTKVIVKEGTPQGGPISPLLSNIVLDELDKELSKRGLKFVRYADDFRIYVKSERSGKRVMESIKRFLEKKLRLKVNEEKSSVRGAEKGEFLGIEFRRAEDGKISVHLSKRSIKRIYEKLRELAPRTWGNTVKRCMERLNEYLTGWEAYFGSLCTESGARFFRLIDAHARRRVRAIIVKQKKRARYLYRHLKELKVRPRRAWKSAHCQKGDWYKSDTKGMHEAYPNKWFSKYLVSIHEIWKDKHLEPVIRVQRTQLSLPLKSISF
jgi:group II intron reverse transcriptase/maturase